MDTSYTNETVVNLFSGLGIGAAFSSPSLDRLVAVNSRYINDLKLNVAATLASHNLSPKESMLLALSVAITEKHTTLIAAFEQLAAKESASAEELAEAHACASLMAVNNIFYRFKHFMHGNEYYNRQPAGLRMSPMMNPAMGKELFELMSLVLSAVNGCEKCVVAHEHSVRELGAPEPKIYDAVRLGAVIKGLCTAL